MLRIDRVSELINPDPDERNNPEDIKSEVTVMFGKQPGRKVNSDGELHPLLGHSRNPEHG